MPDLVKTVRVNIRAIIDINDSVYIQTQGERDDKKTLVQWVNNAGTTMGTPMPGGGGDLQTHFLIEEIPAEGLPLPQIPFPWTLTYALDLHVDGNLATDTVQLPIVIPVPSDDEIVKYDKDIIHARGTITFTFPKDDERNVPIVVNISDGQPGADWYEFSIIATVTRRDKGV